MADKLAILGQPIGVEAVKTLGCKRGVDPTFAEGTQHGKLNDSLESTARYFGIVIPGGDFEITDSIEIPSRWGCTLRGSGGIAKDLGENHFDGDLQGSKQVSRVIWKGDDAGGPMVLANGSGYRIADIHFQGCRVAGPGSEPTGGVYPNRAGLGLHINTSTNGALDASGKCVLDNLSFYQIGTHILIGRDLAGAGDPTYTGYDDSHADTVRTTDTYHWFPFSGEYSGQGTGIHIRNNQSMGHHFGRIISHGNPEQVFWLERGGSTTVDQIQHIAHGGWACRVGYMDVNQGGLDIGYIMIDAGSAGNPSRFLKGDVYDNAISNPKVRIRGGKIPVSCTNVPHIDIGPGHWEINAVNYLKAGSIKLTGGTISGGNMLCHLHLNMCTLYDTNIPGLINGASSGAYLLTWTRCSRYHDSAADENWGYLFDDSTSVTEIKNGGWSRLAYDFAP